MTDSLPEDIMEFMDLCPALARQEGIQTLREWDVVKDALEYDDGDLANHIISEAVAYFVFDRKQYEDTVRRCLHVYWVFILKQPLS